MSVLFEMAAVMALAAFVGALLDPIMRPDEVVESAPFGLRGA